MPGHGAAISMPTHCPKSLRSLRAYFILFSLIWQGISRFTFFKIHVCSDSVFLCDKTDWTWPSKKRVTACCRCNILQLIATLCCFNLFYLFDFHRDLEALWCITYMVSGSQICTDIQQFQTGPSKLKCFALRKSMVASCQ